MNRRSSLPDECHVVVFVKVDAEGTCAFSYANSLSPWLYNIIVTYTFGSIAGTTLLANRSLSRCFA